MLPWTFKSLCLDAWCVCCDMFASTVDGKLEDGRPSLLAKLLSSASELGHSSSSEGEKEFASPEWDVPLSKNSVRKSRPETSLVVSGVCPCVILTHQPFFLFSTCRGWQSSADLPPDIKRRPFPEEIGHSRDLLPSTDLPQLTVPRHLQQCTQQ